LIFEVEFRFNSIDRKRTLLALPRVGERVDLDDGEDGRFVLLVKSVIHIQDGNNWSYHCNCDVRENWLD
jgi:hypothetical protein